MLDELLGGATWPIAFIIAVVAVCITINSVHEANATRDLRLACVKSGGSLGEHNGWPTCTPSAR